MFEQRIIPNDDDTHGGVLIVGLEDGVEVWWSWAPESIDPAVRLNIDHPSAADDRYAAAPDVAYRVPTIDEQTALTDDYDADQHRVVAAYAAVVEAVTVADAAAAVELPEQALIDEAHAWAAAAPAPTTTGDVAATTDVAP